MVSSAGVGYNGLSEEEFQKLQAKYAAFNRTDRCGIVGCGPYSLMQVLFLAGVSTCPPMRHFHFLLLKESEGAWVLKQSPTHDTPAEVFEYVEQSSLSM